jgi:hypothetical protein
VFPFIIKNTVLKQPRGRDAKGKEALGLSEHTTLLTLGVFQPLNSSNLFLQELLFFW